MALTRRSTRLIYGGTNVAHETGKLLNALGKAWRVEKPEKSGFTGTIRGKNHRTKEAIVAAGTSGTVTTVGGYNAPHFNRVHLIRREARGGGRELISGATGVQFTVYPEGTGLTGGRFSEDLVTACPGDFTGTPPDPPEPPAEPSPLPPSAGTNGGQGTGPTDPTPAPEQPAPGLGCSPDDSAQWYNGSTCPPGTRSLGTAELSGGAVMILCEGPGRPPGDGCPAVNEPWGYGLLNGSCVYQANGPYATLAACQAEQPEKPEAPEEPVEPEAPGWQYNGNGTCSLVPGGSETTELECVVNGRGGGGQGFVLEYRGDARGTPSFCSFGADNDLRGITFQASDLPLQGYTIIDNPADPSSERLVFTTATGGIREGPWMRKVKTCDSGPFAGQTSRLYWDVRARNL